MTTLEISGSRTVRDEDGREHDVLASIDALSLGAPALPSGAARIRAQAEVRSAGNYAVVERMLKADNPDSCRAYFRGYQTPNRYWQAPDGQRYWLTKFMISRCWPDSVEPLRRVDEGAKAITDWDGPPWALTASVCTSAVRGARGGRPKLPWPMATNPAGLATERSRQSPCDSLHDDQNWWMPRARGCPTRGRFAVA